MKMIAKLGLMALLIFFLCSVSVVVSADTFDPMGPHADDSESNTFVVGNVEEKYDGSCRMFVSPNSWASFEWKYNTSITGTITQVQVRGGLNPDGYRFSDQEEWEGYICEGGDCTYQDDCVDYDGNVIPGVSDGDEYFECDPDDLGRPAPTTGNLDVFPSVWSYADPLDHVKLYVNGQAIGGASRMEIWDYSGSSTDNSVFIWDDVNIVCENQSVLFEVYVTGGSFWDENDQIPWIILHGAGEGDENTPTDVDGDGDRDLGFTRKVYGSSIDSRVNGVYDPVSKKTIHVQGAHPMLTGCWPDRLDWWDMDMDDEDEHWDPTYQTDMLYEFTYKTGLGGSSNISYTESVLPNKKVIEQYDHAYFDCVLNESLSPNILTVVKDGTEYVNFTSDRKYFTAHWYPEEIGTYTINITRDDTLVAQNTVQVTATESPGAYVYPMDVTPTQTGKYISLFANVTAHMSYEAYIEIFKEGSSVFKEYLGSNESMSFDYETTSEGRFDVELRLEKGLGDDNPLVDTAVFYVQDQEKLPRISMKHSLKYDTEYDISYEQNMGGTHATYLVLQWIDPEIENSTEQEQITYIKRYTGDISYTPTRAGQFTCKLFYENIELYYVNYTVAGDTSTGGTEDPGPNVIFEDIDTIWTSGAVMFGLDEGMFKIIIGAIVVVISMVLPLLLTSKRLGFSVTIPMLSNTNFTLLAGIIGVIIAFALGLWDLWVVFIIGIAIMALFIKSIDRNFIGSRSG